MVKRNDAYFSLSRRGGDWLYHAVNAVKEKQTGRELVFMGDGRRKTRRETSARAVRNREGEDA